MRRHHKIIIGGFSTFLVGIIIANSLFIYFLYGQLQISYNNLDKEIERLQVDTQSKLNELSYNIIKNQNELNTLGSQLGSIDEEFTLLKASVGEDFSDIIEKGIKSVVTIRTDVGQGTGFIISENGFIVTNAHVLLGGREVYAIDYNQKTTEAILLGYNKNIDLALLKIPGKYQALKLADSNKVEIGEKVIAIGNPLGLQFSVSQGIVSGVHRPGFNGEEVYIQTDAALNPGNSGGPLINNQGKIIGINNFKIGGGESLGFALESNKLKEVVNDISLNTINQTLIN